MLITIITPIILLITIIIIIIIAMSHVRREPTDQRLRHVGEATEDVEVLGESPSIMIMIYKW